MEKAVVRNRLRAAQNAQNQDSSFLRNLSLAETAFAQGDFAYCDRILTDLGY